ncbi:MAG: NAD-dependent epimerase/dehydratase [Candidatus Gottesmanbacteria bacterium GW2011_GWA2_43_14]|uniref:NAD-dependent epimerase/dehydratase n=1 Tax=Candidatus Gottesmanbacteria bacterium GW2011_GWA2_43_14 TaxID=1618443 RepID=A0A0G1DE00_9BACT|nr:MAG: NAD-dependent epimerase/dehydratase [Candidatus Gottesmanbacteria bacterium GW2011_GWA2_43_14]
MKILVTGSAGFIGSHLIDRLSKDGFSAIGLDIAENRGRQGKPNAQIDIRDKAGLEKLFKKESFRSIVHLAARGGVRQSIAEPVVFMETNIIGTVNLLELAEKYKVRNIIFASSSSVYGDVKTPFREDMPSGRLLSPYAVSKRAGEDLCRIYHKRSGLKMAVLRFFTVYGPRGRTDMAAGLFTKAVLGNKKLVRFGKGECLRDFTYIDDIVDGVMSVLKAVPDFEIINLGSGRAVSVNGLIETIEKITGKKAAVAERPLNPADVFSTLADISKAKKLLGYRPKWTLEKGMAKFIEWYLKFKQ